MPRSFERAAAALMWYDPRNFQWRAREGTPLPANAEQKLARLRACATLAMGGRSIAESLAQVRDLASARALGTIDQLALGDRRPLVLAHGPSLAALLPAIRAHRDHLFLAVPFRTAVHLASHDIWADVAILADRGITPYRITNTLWSEVPHRTAARLERTATLVVEPFAPASIHERFDRVLLLDDGTGVGSGAALPFWGFALLTCLALPLALGSGSVAIGGIDMKAAAGRRRRTWHGAPARIDAQFATLLGLMEILAWSEGTFVDVSPEAIAKRGFEHESLERYVERLPARGSATVRPGGASAVSLHEEGLGQLVAMLQTQGSIVQSIRTHVDAGLRLVDGPDTAATRRELDDLLAVVERRWPADPAFRSVVAMMQPTYFLTLVQLRARHVRPVHPHEAARRKLKLVCAELSELVDDFEQQLAAARAAVAGSNGGSE